MIQTLQSEDGCEISKA